MPRTQISSYTMLQRISYICRKISAETYPNTNGLAEFLECSEGTIFRDLRFLRDRMDAPIEWDRKRNGYYYSRPWSLSMNL